MDNQLVTIKGVYQNGQIVPLSTFLPQSNFHVLITFLEPIQEEAKNFVSVELTQEEILDRTLMQYHITKKECEVLRFVQQGCSNREIAEKLEISEGTVRNYISYLLDKVGGSNRMELVRLAEDKGLLKP